MMRNSLICKLINVQASMKENNEKKIKKEDEISKLIKAFPKDIAALDKRSVLAKVNSQGSGSFLSFNQPNVDWCSNGILNASSKICSLVVNG